MHAIKTRMVVQFMFNVGVFNVAKGFKIKLAEKKKRMEERAEKIAKMREKELLEEEED